MRLTEHITQATAKRVDRARGVIRGVKIIGETSRNGRRYAPEVLRRAASLYEGAKVNVNHPDQGRENQPRGYQERLGSLHNIRHQTGGLFGDLHYNPKHPLAEQLAWDAEHAPHNLGLSHNAEGRGRKRGGVFIVEEIIAVRSVDLVADPATTAGLFESYQGGNTTREFVAAVTGEPLPAGNARQLVEAITAPHKRPEPKPAESQLLPANAEEFAQLLKG